MILARNFLALVLLLPLSALAAPADGTSPSEVIARLVVNASKTPPGPMENDLTKQSVKGFEAMRDDSMPPAHELIAKEFSKVTLTGPLNSIYSDSTSAVYSAKAKLVPAALADEKADEKFNTTGNDDAVGFGEAGGGAMHIGPKVRDDGQVVATFCLVRQKGAWKVHCAYLSNDPLKDSELNFVVKQLTAFAKKS
jgi:hypothetical protein